MGGKELETKEIKTVKIVKKLNPTDYVFALSGGELVKITVSDLKQSLK